MQNESAHFATTKWILKKGKLYIQANFEIFRDILRAGCHRCVLRFLDLKEKKKIFSLFRAASASSRKTSGLVPSSLCSAGKPVAEPLPLLYRGFFRCCFCPSQHSCQGCKDVSWSSWTDLTPPPRPRTERHVPIKIWNFLPRLFLLADVCSSSCLDSFAICKRLYSSVPSAPAATAWIHELHLMGEYILESWGQNSIVYIFIAMKRVLIDRGVLRVTAHISEFIWKLIY